MKWMISEYVGIYLYKHSNLFKQYVSGVLYMLLAYCVAEYIYIYIWNIYIYIIGYIVSNYIKHENASIFNTINILIKLFKILSLILYKITNNVKYIWNNYLLIHISMNERWKLRAYPGVTFSISLNFIHELKHTFTRIFWMGSIFMASQIFTLNVAFFFSFFSSFLG